MEQANAPGVGAFGGKCTCPDGQVYWVGDKATGLACEGGVAGELGHEVHHRDFGGAEARELPQGGHGFQRQLAAIDGQEHVGGEV